MGLENLANNVTTPGDENVLRSHPVGAQPSMGYPQKGDGGLIIISMPVQEITIQHEQEEKTRNAVRQLFRNI